MSNEVSLPAALLPSQGRSSGHSPHKRAAQTFAVPRIVVTDRKDCKIVAQKCGIEKTIKAKYSDCFVVSAVFGGVSNTFEFVLHNDAGETFKLEMYVRPDHRTTDKPLKLRLAELLGRRATSATLLQTTDK